MSLVCENSEEYVGALSGEKASVKDGHMQVCVSANSGEIWIPSEHMNKSFAPIKTMEIKRTLQPEELKEEPKKTETVQVQEEIREEKKPEQVINLNKPYEEMTVEELQEAILEKMRRNGPVTDYMLGTVRENTHHGSLVNWVKSFG